VRQLRNYWDLLSYRVLADARSENRQLYLGSLWWVLEPLAHMTVLYLIFGVVLQRGGPGFVGFLLVGFVFWRWMDNSIKRAAQSLLEGKMILTQVKLPHWMFPLSAVLSAGLRFLVVLTLLIVFSVIYSGQATLSYLALPFLLLLNLAFIFSLGLLFACLLPFFPDARKVIDNLFQLLFFASGIFFDFRSVGEVGQVLLQYNPFAAFLGCYRGILLEGVFPELTLLYAPLVATAGFVLCAGLLYKRVRPELSKALLR
jgi:lipopolysaccharide transport system permease protein